MSNPYANFKDQNGVIQDPFRIATQWCMPAPVFECLKKLLCPGLDGRKKNRLEDLEDALATLDLCEERKGEFVELDYILDYSLNTITVKCYGETLSVSKMLPLDIVKLYNLTGDHEKSVGCFLFWVLSSYADNKWYVGCKGHLITMIRESEWST